MTKSHDVVLRDAYAAGPPPVNFAVVLPGLYRSGYPQAEDYPFMRSLKLKTIVTLVGKDLPDGYEGFIRANGIKHEIFDMAGTKKADIPIATMRSIIAIVGNRKNYPLLIHCNQGKHRTGCVVGVLRKVQEWDTSNIIREYKKYAEPKVRETDVEYIAKFKLSDLPRALSRSNGDPYVVRAFYGMMMLASFTLSVWIYSGTRLLMLITT
ncbi:tyrosine phosphatase family-domain-containing protein [Hypomontagnella monticulosa]|nr:tyrosine phosphatase family-domain-containing protein [Hypomontagnella monticulosa]